MEPRLMLLRILNLSAMWLLVLVWRVRLYMNTLWKQMKSFFRFLLTELKLQHKNGTEFKSIDFTHYCVFIYIRIYIRIYIYTFFTGLQLTITFLYQFIKKKIEHLLTTYYDVWCHMHAFYLYIPCPTCFFYVLEEVLLFPPKIGKKEEHHILQIVFAYF